MHLSHLHQLAISLPFFSMLAGTLVVLFIFIGVGILHYAFMRIGLRRCGASLTV